MIFLEKISLNFEAIRVGINLFAAAVILLGFWLYNRSDHKVSAGTWFILASGEFLDFGSYWDMVGGNVSELATRVRLDMNILAPRFALDVSGEEWVKSIVPAAFALGTIATFSVAFVRKRFTWPDAKDWFIVFTDALITWYWVATGSAITTNLLFQGTTIMAFIPMYRALHNRKGKETFWPWMLWTIAYVGFLYTAVISFGNQLAEIVYPMVGVISHAIVILYVLRENKRKKVRP